MHYVNPKNQTAVYTCIPIMDELYGKQDRYLQTRCLGNFGNVFCWLSGVSVEIARKVGFSGSDEILNTMDES